MRTDPADRQPGAAADQAEPHRRDSHQPGPLVAAGAETTVAGLFETRAREHPEAPAVVQGGRVTSYAALARRAGRLALHLAGRGIGRRDRIAILSENRAEYLEAQLAAARLGAILACQNWRLAVPELRHCVDLVEPGLVLVSPRYRETLARVAPRGEPPVLAFGPAYEAALAAADGPPPPIAAAYEDPLFILYTSGTTGLPKGAVISHRAEVIRNIVTRAEFGLRAGDSFVGWTPLFHMGGADLCLGTLLSGGKVILLDGFDAEGIAEIVAAEPLGWLIVMPGMVDQLAAMLRRRRIRPAGVRLCGVMPDLVPPQQLAEITTLLDAPYASTFGSTETGCVPASPDPIPVGAAPQRFPKRISTFCEARLLDEAGRPAGPGEAGEMAVRGPTLFSGYWRAPETNEHDFRGGWFHMGDVFRRNHDGTIEFVDRAKYMIKSGGENIYPAEIERVLMAEPRVVDAAVIKRPDDRWGEVPVAFVARTDDSLDADALYRLCRQQLAGYKQPKDIRFVAMEAFPRSASGKIQRHEMADWIAD